jgi:hypothetical protein
MPDTSRRSPCPRVPGLLLAACLFLAPAVSAAQRPENPPPVTDQTKAAGSVATDPQSEAAQLQELKRQLDALAAEVEQLRSGEDEQPVTDERRRALGLAPSAAATYRKKQGVSLAGYGEMLYERFDPQLESGTRSPKGAQLDFLRMILYAGYRFTDRFLFNSEIEIEHANEASVEFAYIDYLANDHVTLRGGLLLVPLGLVNEFHEPTVFIGARRPETESRIIPSTWRENGGGVLGTAGPVNYRVYVLNGLNAAGFSADGLRGGRQKGSRAQAADLAVAGRVDYNLMPGIFAGGAFYRDGADQDQFVVNGTELNETTTIGEIHAQAAHRGFDVRALYAHATVDNAGRISQARGLTGARSIAETMRGGYMQVGYNVLSPRTTRVWLTPYYRFEAIDTQNSVASGFVADPSKDGTFHTVGVELRPIYHVVVKADYQIIRNKAQGGRNQFNLNLGYAF